MARRGKKRRRSRYSSGLSFYEDPKSVNIKAVKEAILWIITTVISVSLAVVCFRCFGFRVTISDSSMSDGIAENQSVLVNKLSYQLTTPDRGDVIAFYPGGDDNIYPSVKRIIAIPGDSVQIVDGVLLVNGVPSALKDTFGTITFSGTATNMMILEDEEYYVIGDNPQDSEDSRSAGIGTVGEDDIIGKVWIALPSENGSLHFVE